MAQLTEVGTTAEFMRLIESSQVLTADELAKARRLADETRRVKMLARRCVAKGLLTRWQAGQLLVGWHKLRLGPYRLTSQLGKGHLGRVFLAQHMRLDRQVALKTLSRRFTRQPEIVERFLQEAREAAELDHRNLLHVYDIGTDGDQYYLVVEYVVGSDLEQWVEQNGPMGVEQAADCLRQAAEGLAYAHDRRMLHRDLHPANVMLDESGFVKVLGFGVGHLVASERSAASDGSTGAEPTESTPSRHHYTAPEQQTGQTVDACADIYALGQIGLYLLSGRHADESRMVSLAASLGKAWNQAPAAIRTLLGNMTAADPADRPQRADEVVRDLTEFLRDEVRHSPFFIDSRNLDSGSSGRTGGDARAASSSIGSEESADDDDSGLTSVRDAWLGRSSRFWWVAGSLIGVLLLTAGLVLWWPDAVGMGTGGELAATRPVQPPRTRTANHSGSSAAQKSPQRPFVAQHSTLPVPGAAHVPAEKKGPSAGRAANKKPAGKKPAGKKPAGKKKPTDSTGSNEKRADKEPDEAKPDSAKPAGAKPGSAKPDGAKPGPPPDAQASKKPAEKGAPAVSKPDPFRHLPDVVDLPLSTDGGMLDLDPMELGAVEWDRETPLAARLLGAEFASPSGRIFFLQPRIGSGPNHWQVKVRAPSKPAADDSLPIAHLQVADTRLSFQWTDAAETTDDAACLRNCILELSSGAQRHRLRLRTPMVVGPLVVDLKKPRIDPRFCRWELEAAPDGRHVRLEILGAGAPLPEPYVLDPVGPVPLVNDARLQIRFGKNVEDQVLFLDMRPQLTSNLFRITTEAKFRLLPLVDGKLEVLTSRVLAKTEQMVAQNQAVVLQRVQAIKAGVLKIKRNDPKYKRAEQTLKVAQAELQRASAVTQRFTDLLDLRRALAEENGGPIHFRLFYETTDGRVDLLSTTGGR